MIYKTKYSLQKCEFDSINNINYDFEEDYFKSNIDIYSRAPYKYVDDDDDYIKFKKQILKGAEGLANCSNDDEVMMYLNYFENSEYYIRYDIHNILLHYDTYEFLVDIIDINPNNQFPFLFDPSELKIQIIEKSFKIMVFMTSKFTEFATKKFYDLKYIDKFFRNMTYYRKVSNNAYCRGLNIIANLLHDLPIFYDQAEFVTKEYLGRVLQFIDLIEENKESEEEENPENIKIKENQESIKAEFFLIFAFSTSIPSPDQLKLAIKKRKNSIQESNKIHEIVKNFAGRIVVFLENYKFIDSEEATYLFRSLLVICDKYNDICNTIFLEHMRPFLEVLNSENKKSIELSIDFFRLLYKVKIFVDCNLFAWDVILKKITTKSHWILSFIDFVDELHDSFYFFWENNIYTQFIENFENFSFKARCKVFYMFFKLLKDMPPEVCVNYLLKNNILSIFFPLLEDDDNALISDLLQGLKIINSHARTLNEIKLVVEQYNQYDANFILDNLPPEFTGDLEEIHRAIES